MKCQCGKRATFENPKAYCDNCWADWWVKGIKDFTKRQKEKEKTLRAIRERRRTG